MAVPVRRRALLACAGLLALLLGGAARAEPAIAAAWQLKTPDGQLVRYPQDARGEPTVLLFWPSWCPYSRALQPYVQDIWRDYRDHGVHVWTINIKESGDPVRTMRERGLSFPLLVDGDALIDRYGIERTPWLVVIDGAQRIVYTRPASAPSPIDVARTVRETLNALLGERALPLPASYPPPYDLHLRDGAAQSSHLASAAAADAEWKPWAKRYLEGIGADERVAGLAPLGAIADGKAAIAAARDIWTQRYGAEAVARQAPYRAYRQGTRWLVAGAAAPGRLGSGYLLVVDSVDGVVIRVADGSAGAP
ncbi:peroxiredoxin family protein [Solimonas soli]|uniref:peroxiredoxin family protein n=1 Tax=Solimonas soli TaxID=413479 RepID=UPI000480B11B|nr:TlpA disulfide reductase family protein [Solimonas soli]